MHSNLQISINQLKNNEKLCQFFFENHKYFFKIYSKTLIETSTIVPAIENLGFVVIEIEKLSLSNDINQFDIQVRPYKSCHFTTQIRENIEFVLSNVILPYNINNDKFNSLILYAELSYKDVMICRMYANYIKQLQVSYSQSEIITTLLSYANITKQLVSLFNKKFNDIKNEIVCNHISNNIKLEIDAVSNALHDKILRAYLEVIIATKRTNFFANYDYIAIKILSNEVSFMPLPKPLKEIFVYSNDFEGIHLRGGEIARGGIRWSERADYRTEVLGLMKAQVVKNSVIIPTGSKGGFILKNQPAKDIYLTEGIRCYKLFLCGLLDLTDNYEDNNIVQKDNIWDEEDPYLVVAADKGTATFSDYANAISLQYNFWLKDAFASGGSTGYDHKKLGITSRGVWISVLQHLKVLNINLENQEIRTIGIGDMSGDVFGNGMLMSNKILLVAAFNHMHIFIDPTPNALTSYAERKRLFNKPNSQWSDYNHKLISKGGGIFARTDKFIMLNNEIKNALGIDLQIEKMTPENLIRAILKSPVDLLWNGGIGTYVKSSLEENEQIGDKTNNILRINGKDLRCKVVGEGGNLGFTQLGRVEYARNGGCINTDAIDNSGGVDCSDHEVNLKIAFSQMLFNKVITIEERNILLKSMSAEVCELVLNDNRLQTQILSIESFQSKEKLSEHIFLINLLERQHILNRDVEKLPSATDLKNMLKNQSHLTIPDLCILLAYAKNSGKKMLNNTDILLNKNLYKKQYLSYFPQILIKYEEYLLQHKLSTHILNTVIINDIVNTMGCTYFHLMVDWQSIAPINVVKAYYIVKYGLQIDKTWQLIEKQSNIDTLKNFKLIQFVIARNIDWILHGQLDEIYNSDTLYNQIYSSIDNLIASMILTCNLNDFHKLLFIQNYSLDIFFASKKYNFNINDLLNIYQLLRHKLRLDKINNYVLTAFDQLRYQSKVAAMAVIRSLDALLIKLEIAFIQFIGHTNITDNELDKLHDICLHNSFEKYIAFIDDIDDCTNDIVSLLLLIKNRMKTLLNSIRNEIIKEDDY